MNSTRPARRHVALLGALVSGVVCYLVLTDPAAAEAAAPLLRAHTG
jgi:hypothetical protein